MPIVDRRCPARRDGSLLGVPYLLAFSASLNASKLLNSAHSNPDLTSSFFQKQILPRALGG